MSCPTCDHTMAALGYANGGTWWHCARCGTVKHLDTISRGEPEPTIIVPTLVVRCRDFEAVAASPVDDMLWRTLGVAESINLPKDRLRS